MLQPPLLVQRPNHAQRSAVCRSGQAAGVAVGEHTQAAVLCTAPRLRRLHQCCCAVPAHGL